MQYQEWMQEWLDFFVRPTVKAHTYEQYVDMSRRIIAPRLGGLDIQALSPAVLQKFAAELLNDYSVNTVHGVIAVVRRSLKRAQLTGVVEHDYSGGILLPHPREKEVSCFTVCEQKKIERAVLESGKDRLFGIVLCLYTGVRIGELFALEWSDIDMFEGILSISKTCRDGWSGGRYCKRLDTPKTHNSYRKIPIPKQLVHYLKGIRKRSKSSYIISGRDGRHVAIRSYQKSFERLLKREGISHHGFHALRHTFATRALECGMDVKTLSEILGHKNAKITLDRYAHCFFEHKRSMMDRVGKMLQ